MENPILPASSLKGVLRSTAELILRSMNVARSPDLPPLAPHPFGYTAGKETVEEAESWKRYLDQPRSAIADQDLADWAALHPETLSKADLAPSAIYAHLSAISQLFGTTHHRGLVVLDDAMAPNQVQRRPHVAIDRVTGGVGEGPFEEEVVTDRQPLETQLTITNFALWQLGLLTLVFQEISRGYAGIGGGTRKGHGQVAIELAEATFCYRAASYGESKGIVSAQALAKATLAADDVPLAVVSELSRPLLAHLQATASSDWREAGFVYLEVPESALDQLQREAVVSGWQSWIEQL